jgi:uncharacterized protein YodC (DUF2158 family)
MSRNFEVQPMFTAGDFVQLRHDDPRCHVGADGIIYCDWLSGRRPRCGTFQAAELVHADPEPTVEFTL